MFRIESIAVCSFYERFVVAQKKELDNREKTMS